MFLGASLVVFMSLEAIKGDEWRWTFEIICILYGCTIVLSLLAKKRKRILLVKRQSTDPGEFSLHAHQRIHRTGKPRKSQTNRQLLPFKPQVWIVTPPKTNIFAFEATNQWNTPRHLLVAPFFTRQKRTPLHKAFQFALQGSEFCILVCTLLRQSVRHVYPPGN